MLAPALRVQVGKVLGVDASEDREQDGPRTSVKSAPYRDFRRQPSSQGAAVILASGLQASNQPGSDGSQAPVTRDGFGAPEQPSPAGQKMRVVRRRNRLQPQPVAPTQSQCQPQSQLQASAVPVVPAQAQPPEGPPAQPQAQQQPSGELQPLPQCQSPGPLNLPC